MFMREVPDEPGIDIALFVRGFVVGARQPAGFNLGGGQVVHPDTLAEGVEGVACGHIVTAQNGSIFLVGLVLGVKKIHEDPEVVGEEVLGK